MSQKSENFQLKTLRQNSPTPLHAADLQFQAFAEFDCSRALPDIQVPTLVLTGDLDQLISPQNSRIIASLIPGARLIIIPGCGHRLMWEATDECVAFVTEFLTNVYEGRLDSAAVSLTLKNRSDRTAIRRSQRTQLRAGRQCHLLPLSTSGEFLLSGGRLNVLNDPRLDV